MENGSFGALTGVRVIDLSRILAGPYCTQILGDHGADVIKVEPPQGDDTRAWGPPFVDGTASYFIGMNRNKRGIVLDLRKPEARDALLGLLETADVLLENFRVGALQNWGLGDDAEISARFPRLVHCRISGFGEGGPLGGLPGYDAVAQAMSGLMSVNGPEGGDPVRIGIPVVDLATGLNAAVGVMMALFERTKSGKGQFLEISLQDSGMSLLHPFLANYHIDGRIAKPSGNTHPNITPYDSFQTATGQVFLGVGNDGQFGKLCQFLGRAELATDARFQTNANRTMNRSELRVILESHLRRYEGVALAEALMKIGVPCGPILDIGQVANHPHTQYSGMLVEIDDYKGTASPIRLSRTPVSYRRKPPKFGQHSAEILRKPFENS